MHFLERGILWLTEVTPTPTTDQPFDPNDVTPGPLGFFATVFLFLAVGLLAMSLMRRSARMQERWAVREQLEQEAAAEDAARAAAPEASAPGASGADASGLVSDEPDDRPKQGQ